MTTDDARSLLEAHGFRVAHASGLEVRGVFGDTEVFLYRSLANWWAVSAKKGITGKPQRVGQYNAPETHVQSLQDWLRAQLREAVAA